MVASSLLASPLCRSRPEMVAEATDLRPTWTQPAGEKTTCEDLESTRPALELQQRFFAEIGGSSAFLPGFRALSTGFMCKSVSRFRAIGIALATFAQEGSC